MNLSARPAPPRPFGWFREQAVHDVTLGNPAGLQAQVMTWGAVIRCLSLPDAAGGRLPLTLGFESFDPYPDHSPYFGATVGRYANRIGNGQFDLAGETCRLDRNEAQKTTLHGGRDGFARRIWDIEDVTPDSIALGLISADGDQGFPGTLRARCIYRIIDGHRLEVRFEASTDRATPVNLAQHSYFNLDGGRDTAGHRLQIFADAYTPTGSDKIPTGEIRSVAGSAFDFREPRLLRDDPPVFDHNFALSAPVSNEGLRPAARLTSPRSGITMLVETTKPGLQFYGGAQLDLSVPGHGGRLYGPKAGLCLETQYFPDSPNQPGFPACILAPSETYLHRTVFSFATARP